MRYWAACEANVTAEEAIEECARHHIRAVVRSAECGSHTLVDGETGDVIAHADHHEESCGGDVLGLSRILTKGRPWIIRRRIVTRMGEDGLLASFAPRIEPYAGGRPPSASIYTVHQYESMPRNRFKTVVGRSSFDARSCRNDHPKLPPLYRANRPQEEHSPLLCAVHRAKPVRRSLIDASVGKNWNGWADFGPSFRTREGCCCSLPGTASTKAGSRIRNCLAKQASEWLSPWSRNEIEESIRSSQSAQAASSARSSSIWISRE